MKICILIDDYMPNSIKVGAKMMHELSCDLVKNGHNVSVFTPNTISSKSLILDTLDGVNIYRFKLGEIKNVTKIKRAINETLLSVNAWKYGKKFFKNNHHDLIIYYSPSIFWGSLVKKLKKEWNAPSYLILRDFFPQWTIDHGILKEKSIVTKYFKFFEKINYDVADTIGIMSPKNLEWFKNYYQSDAKLEVLYNWAELNSFQNSTNKYRKQLKLENKIIYFYGGNLGYAQDMMNIVRLAINMRNETVAHFLLVGAGDEFELIKEKIVEHKLKNITLLPSVNQNEFKQILSEVDVGLFTLNKNHITHNFPGKLLGYMVQGIPILGSINFSNDLKEIIENSKSGLISVNGEDDLLYKNALNLMHAENRKSMGRNAFNLLETTFSVESIRYQILKGINHIDI
jgi:glycosyltransferase involved in cell wall biosynthesis